MDGVNIHSLDYLVNNTLAKLGLPQGRYYQKFLQIYVNCYREMNLVGVMPNFRTATIPIDPLTNSAILPKDLIDYMRIGACCGGHFINWDYNPEICIEGVPDGIDCKCTPEQIQETVANICAGRTEGIDSWLWAGVNETGIYTALGPNFGLGPGFYRGGYNINNDKTAIHFDTYVHASSVTIEYKASGFDNMGDAMVPETAIPAMMAYQDWQRNLLEFERTGRYHHQALARDYQNQFSARLSEMNSRDEALNMREWLRIFWNNTFNQVKC